MTRLCWIVETYNGLKGRQRVQTNVSVFQDIDDMNAYVTYLITQDIEYDWYSAKYYESGSIPA